MSADCDCTLAKSKALFVDLVLCDLNVEENTFIIYNNSFELRKQLTYREKRTILQCSFIQIGINCMSVTRGMV